MNKDPNNSERMRPYILKGPEDSQLFSIMAGYAPAAITKTSAITSEPPLTPLWPLSFMPKLPDRQAQES